MLSHKFTDPDTCYYTSKTNPTITSKKQTMLFAKLTVPFTKQTIPFTMRTIPFKKRTEPTCLTVVVAHFRDIQYTEIISGIVCYKKLYKLQKLLKVSPFLQIL